MREEVAAVVLGDGERGRQLRGRGQEAGVAAAYRGPHQEERDRGRRDPGVGPGGLLAQKTTGTKGSAPPTLDCSRPQGLKGLNVIVSPTYVGPAPS